MAFNALTSTSRGGLTSGRFLFGLSSIICLVLLSCEYGFALEPPVVISTSPSAHTIDAAISSDIKITFNRQMDSASIVDSAIYVFSDLRGHIDGTITYLLGSQRAVFVPDQPFAYGARISVTLTERAETVTGQPLSGGYSWSFTTEVRPSTGTLSLPTTHNAADEPMAIIAADIDLDGDIDILTANHSTENIVLLYNDGSGAFYKYNSYFESPSGYANDLALLDIDNDGDLDLAVVGGYLSILYNSGPGTFGNRLDIPVTGGPVVVAAADINHDGYTDILTGNASTADIKVFYNNQSGGVAAPVSIPATGQPYDFVTGDLNNDGFIDIAAAGLSSVEVAVILNQRNGTFASPVDYITGNRPRGIIIADLNHDFDADLAVAHDVDDNIVLLENLGSTFAIGPGYGTDEHPLAIKSADIDGDGDVDLITANIDTDNISLLKNNGPGTFGPAAHYSAGITARDVAMADFDGDGDLDIAAANYGSDNVSVFFNIGLPNQAPEIEPLADTSVFENDSLLLIVRATDPDGDSISLSADSLPDGAVFTDSGFDVATLFWKPSSTQAGVYTVLFYATDEVGLVDTADVTITVFNSNIAPVLDSIANQFVYEKSDLFVPVAATDNDGDSIILSASNLPPNAQFADFGNGSGLFGFVPGSTQSGIYDILITASDTLLADSQWFTVEVHDVNPIVSKPRIDGDSAAFHVTNHWPVIEWAYADTNLGHPQEMFEVQVGTDNNWTVAEMWATGTLIGADTVVTYTGSALADGAAYFVRVRAHNGVDWSAWSPNAVFRMNSIPSIPMLLWPDDDGLVPGSTPTLWIDNSGDAEYDPIRYDFVLFDSLGTAVYITESLPSGPDTTGWTVPAALVEDRLYLWNCRAFDGYEYSDWSAMRSFWINELEQSPSPFDIIQPPTDATSQIYSMPIAFIWGSSSDPDPLDSILYRLELSLDSNFTFISTHNSLADTHLIIPDIAYGTSYWWRVFAVDSRDNFTPGNSIGQFITWVLGDVNTDGSVNVGDAILLVNYIFKNGPAPEPLKIGDVTGDCTVNVGDAVYLINYIFRSSPGPMVGCAAK